MKVRSESGKGFEPQSPRFESAFHTTWEQVVMISINTCKYRLKSSN